MKRVLILTNYFKPAVKGGGPIQSISNLIDNLSHEIKFSVITGDRDLGDNEQFKNIKTNTWKRVGKTEIFYTNIRELNFIKLAKLLNDTSYDSLYLNSFFSYKTSILPILMCKIGVIKKRPIILAPRGEFSPGALFFKNSKKKIFIKLSRMIGMYDEITWHATAETEKNDITKIFGNTSKIAIANNLTENYSMRLYDKDITKKKGELSIVFISRIHPKKNLKMAIDLLKSIRGEVEFNIYGPLEDDSYWNECKGAIAKLPPNIQISYHGVVDHSDIIKVFKNNHVFLFPTLGENFGHVISEALIGGCPVIISDQTPWRGLEEQNVGWDIPLSNDKKYVQVLQKLVNMTGDEYKNLSIRAFEYGKLKSTNLESIESYINLFDYVDLSEK